MVGTATARPNQITSSNAHPNTWCMGTENRIYLFALLRAQAGSAVGQLDVKLGSTLSNKLALLARNVVCDLTAVAAVVHHKQLEVSLLRCKRETRAMSHERERVAILITCQPQMNHFTLTLKGVA